MKFPKIYPFIEWFDHANVYYPVNWGTKTDIEFYYLFLEEMNEDGSIS